MEIKIKDLKSKEELIDFLVKYIDDSINLARRKTESEEGYELPTWALHQANQLGHITALKKIRNVISK